MGENKKQKNVILSGKEKRADQSGRRSFLKKAAYSAPALITLGQLAKPSKVHADGSHGPSGPPDDGWNVGY
ncbi:MAG: hypothetical protein P794_05435 [Epsilonproteobacteria bacterium (ex Lamellibrachia satsuma)]|nr:MAG: hypothetical protein P794_05435 [Epsilonproteobacteria bacterium (ex Lamellibrachia satsuma)]